MRGFLLILIFLSSLWTASAQMKSGAQMKDYDSVFGVVTGLRSYPYDVVLLDSTPSGGVLSPGVQPKLNFLFTNRLDTPLETDAQFRVISYGTRSVPGNIWLPQMVKFSDLPPLPFHVSLPAHGSQTVEIEPTLPEKFGAYAFVADLGSVGSRFAASCVRTFAPSSDSIQYPKQALDASVGLDILQAMGVQAVRLGFGYVPTTDPGYPAAMADLDARLQDCRNHHITVILMFLNGRGDPEPLGRGRPRLDDHGVMFKSKEDLVWPPSSDADFKSEVAAIGTKYGWPNGPVTSVLLWNEPWEGTSISGWGADSIRFRELFTAMSEGVEDARAAGAQILIAGCDSSSNTIDKLFADGKDFYLKWLDVCSIHYQGLASPAILKPWRDRQGPNGRVKIWDTESWVANTDDRVLPVIAATRAAGYDRTMGVFGGNVSSETQRPVKMPDGTLRKIDSFFPWSTAASIAAVDHFIGERSFHEFLFKKTIPWIMLFDGLDHQPDDGTVVVVGDLGATYPNIIFRSVRSLAELKEKEKIRSQLDALAPDSPDRADLEQKLAAPEPFRDCQLSVANPAGEFHLYDFYGTEIPSSPVLQVPLDDRGFFLRTNAASGSFARLVSALQSARIEGLQPVQIIAHDLLTPVDQKGSLRLTITNVLNRPVSGSLHVTLGDLKLGPVPTLSLSAQEVREISIPITGGAARPDNAYPLACRFDAGNDGFAIERENLHVNQIAHRTIQVDGNLDDWKGVLPQIVHAADDQGPSLMEAAWLPFAKFDVSRKSGLATGYLAYDDRNFYFAAKIADDTPSPGALRFANRDNDADFYPPTSYEYDAAQTLLKQDFVWKEPTREKAALFLPGSSTERSFTAWVPAAQAFAVSLALPEGEAHKVSFYFVDWDLIQNGRKVTSIEVQNEATQKVLASTVVKEYAPGNYVSFLLSGKVRVVFRGANTFGSSLSGIFFDPGPVGTTPASATAQLAGIDLQTGAAWQGHYGQDGYEVFGAPAHDPAYVQVSVPDIEVKKTYTWPEGVRRYSYRRVPQLPFGSSAPKFDNVQIAFNVLPEDQKGAAIPYPPGTMPGFTDYVDTDYEYALNPVAAAYGGGTEIWRCLVPGMPMKHFYPRQPASPYDGAVQGGQLVIRRDGNMRIVEAAIPWSELPLVKKALDANGTIKFTFRVNDSEGPSMELAENRSVSRTNSYTLHPSFVQHWANELEFSFAK